MAAQNPPFAQLAERPLDVKEQATRNGAVVNTDSRQKESLCAVEINVGVFFDGTNNSKDRDQTEVLQKGGTQAHCSHSNVVVLHDAFPNEVKNGFFRIYVPGVGTPFRAVKEHSETPDGKAKATGGDARINWALIQVLNSMRRAIDGESLVSTSKATEDSTTLHLHAPLSAGSNLGGKQYYFSRVLAELKAKLAARLPKKLTSVTLYVFGFSRGAAQARAFCHFLEHALLQKKGGNYTLAGVPFRLQFLGLFDTVASVGLADSSPFWRGLGGWANGTLDIAPCVQRTVHLVAAHEIRLNFPVSTIRTANKGFPRNAIEKVYPGAHSDVGGGYPSGAQGKSVGARSRLLSQMPLLDMYREARVAGVPLLTVKQLGAKDGGNATAADLDIDKDCAQLFNAYLEWAAPAAAGTLEQTLNNHMQLYWQWRMLHKGKVDRLPSYAKADQQDRIDVRESDGDFCSDEFKALQTQSEIANHMPLASARELPQMLTEAQADFLRLRKEWQGRPAKLPVLVHRFFDEMVHDSHASFYMAGPVTDPDRKEKIRQIQERYDHYRQQLAQPGIGQIKNGAMADRMARESLSDLEQRIFDYQRSHNGGFSPISDKDRNQLLAMEDLITSGAVRLVTENTRRELGGHIRYRRVFDKS